jgi:hypothetical protein
LHDALAPAAIEDGQIQAGADRPQTATPAQELSAQIRLGSESGTYERAERRPPTGDPIALAEADHSAGFNLSEVCRVTDGPLTARG